MTTCRSALLGPRPTSVQLERLSADLRRGAADVPVLCYIKRNTGILRAAELESFIRYVTDHCPQQAPAPLKSHRSDGTGIRLKKEYPNRAIVDFLAAASLEEQLFAYLSRFYGPCSEDTALACERLQTIPLNWSLNLLLQRSSGLRPKHKLNYFRLAQKIRNEHGTTRRNSPSTCFNSFEDIVELERKIESNDVMDFLLECISLKLVDSRHAPRMYECTKTIPQLETLHERLKHAAATDLHRDGLGYRLRFEKLYNGGLPWRALRNYLTNTDCVNPEMISEASISEAELDEALNCVLNNLLRKPFESPFNAGRIVQSLLRRGASLFFRDPSEEMFSLAALVRYAQRAYERHRWVFPLRKFLPCCSLKIGSGGGDFKAKYDARRLSPLSCLATRKIQLPACESRLPRTLRAFVEAHQQLQSQLEGRDLIDPTPPDTFPKEVATIAQLSDYGFFWLVHYNGN